MYENTLTQIGLSPEQAQVYELLLKSGSLRAGQIAKRSPLKRGLVYKVLEQLAALGLISKKNRSGQAAVFEAEHPARLAEFLETQEQQRKNAKAAIEGVLGQLTSDYNLAAGKPGVRFFEGLEGIKKTLEDSLSAHSIIYSYADVESISRYIEKVNQEYVVKREKLRIKKRGIILDTPFSRQYLANYHPEVTDVRFIKLAAKSFESIMQIYDGKISYITLTPNRMIGVILEDPHIFEMHKYLFEFMWDLAQAPNQKS